MASATERKRAERARQREEGRGPLNAVIPLDLLAWLAREAERLERTQSEALELILRERQQRGTDADPEGKP